MDRKIKQIPEKYSNDFAEMSTESLVILFGDALRDYWTLSDALTLRESRRSEGRMDLTLARICSDIEHGILSRTTNEIMKLKVLLADSHPGVRLRVADILHDLGVSEALRTLEELALRPCGVDGLPDGYAARARALIG